MAVDVSVAVHVRSRSSLVRALAVDVSVDVAVPVRRDSSLRFVDVSVAVPVRSRSSPFEP